MKTNELKPLMCGSMRILKEFTESQNSNRYPNFNFTILDYFDDGDDFDIVIDSLSGRLISERSSESPSTSRKEPSASTDSSLIPCSEIKVSEHVRKLIFD
ncbi:hypothetical protein AVEN_40973-1 [Araneus ventricosus]|uniref:Uncharacterized protein n=1 Tax=Araneus ventricosus TaxID=182803 RepID=A0A4Y2FBR6_ARAVE|nr:hypothetical protein AVEN_40973-1 [Araneus ventricosus]